MNLNRTLLLISVILVLAILFMLKQCVKPIDQPIVDANALKFSLDSMTSVNKAIIMDFKAFKTTSLAKEDSLTKLIQAKASKNTISIAAISTKVSSQDSGTTVVTPGPKQLKGDSTACDPIYSFDKVDTTEEVHVRATKDSTHVSFLLFNRQIVESKFQSSGFLGMGKKSIVLDVTNSNPKIRTLNQISYVAPLPKPNRLLWLLGGAVAGSVTYIYLHK